MGKIITQERQVIETLERHHGYATLGELYYLVDTSQWKTKTADASIRRIVQQSKEIFKIQPGLWGLEALRQEVLHRLELSSPSDAKKEPFTHSYYQGLLVQMGRMKQFTTYVPPQDQHKKFLEKELKAICSTVVIPPFGWEELVARAKTVDVIWFNRRKMPNSFFEVECTTDIQNSVVKFCDLQDYHSHFVIVAPQNRYKQFCTVMERTVFAEFKKRVEFASFEAISREYEWLCKRQAKAPAFLTGTPYTSAN